MVVTGVLREADEIAPQTPQLTYDNGETYDFQTH